MTDTPGPGPGHNSGGIAADRLRSLIERIERLEEERKALGSSVIGTFNGRGMDRATFDASPADRLWRRSSEFSNNFEVAPPGPA